MSIVFLGDLHGNTAALCHIIDFVQREISDITAMIQVGDFGFYKNIIPYLQSIKPEFPIYAIDGNHEDHILLSTYSTVTEVAPNIFYVPRGTIMELDGKKIGFLGGAASVDKAFRLRHGYDWYPEEIITEDDYKKFDGIDYLDVLVTHTPPNSTIQRNFDQNNLCYFGLPPTWVDPSSLIVERLWGRLGCPKLVCGHFHKNVRDGNVLILDINQIWCM